MNAWRGAMVVLLAIGLYRPPVLFASEASAGPSSQEALSRLTEGNQRFVNGSTRHPGQTQDRRCETFAGGQHPFATVLSCADSRVPVELLFDQGIGDLFVVRVAGNVADTDETGTVEYGVGHLGTPLVVVLGHGKCGAVTAVAEKASLHGCMADLVDNIAPAVERVRKERPGLRDVDLLQEAIKANVWQSIQDLLAHSAELRSAVAEGKVQIVGAVYDLHGGGVQWMGAHPDQAKLLANPPAVAPHTQHSTSPQHNASEPQPGHANFASGSGKSKSAAGSPVALGFFMAGAGGASWLCNYLIQRRRRRG